jgi:transposase InsO family protein
MSRRPRRNHASAFKAKVAIAAIKGDRTLVQLAEQFVVHQVWAMDITYVPMARGFIYLVAVMDWFSRRVLSWRVSITMEAAFCIEALEEALARHGNPQICARACCESAASSAIACERQNRYVLILSRQRDRASIRGIGQEPCKPSAQMGNQE